MMMKKEKAAALIVVLVDENEEVGCIKCHNAKTRRYNYKHVVSIFKHLPLGRLYKHLFKYIVSPVCVCVCIAYVRIKNQREKEMEWVFSVWKVAWFERSEVDSYLYNILAVCGFIKLN